MSAHAVKRPTPVQREASLPDRAPELSSLSGGGGSELRIRGLVKSYGGTPVLRSLDLDVRSGEFVSIVGRSGCGKSTLLRLVAALDAPDGGEIAIGHGREQSARMMFQEPRLLPWRSVLDNVGLGLARPWKERALATLAEVGLEAHAAKWPAQLSGGQRQRVALARALIHEPKLLLLDEPLGALDALTRLEMQGLIERVRARHAFTVLLVTHDVEEAVALGDRVIVLDAGHIVLDVEVALPRPRASGSAAFVRIKEAVLARVLSLAQ